MASLPPVLHRATRDHPLILLGIVMGALLAGLLALPFLAQTLPRTAQRAASVAGTGRHS